VSRAKETRNLTSTGNSLKRKHFGHFPARYVELLAACYRAKGSTTIAQRNVREFDVAAGARNMSERKRNEYEIWII